MDKRNIKDLIPYDKNPRKNKEAVDAVLESLKRHGQIKPLVLSAKGKPFDSEVICCGHTTLAALKKFGAKEAKVVLKEFESEAEFIDYNIRDNKSGEFAEWDEPILAELAGEFEIDLTEMGFEFDLEPESTEGLTDEDDVPEEAPPVAKLGDIWTLGNHRLMCGDSTDREQVDRLMGGEKADMVFTDPPYGYRYESNYQNKHKMILNDDKFIDFIPFLPMADNCAVFICGSYQTISEWIQYAKKHLSIKNLIVWKKNNWSMGDLKGAFAGQYELIIYGCKGKVDIVGSRDTDVWEFDREPPNDHPTQKPVELVAYAINKMPSKVVADLFGGSGTTLISCEKTGRKCRMMELDERYCDVIIKRWEDFTGKKAVKEG